jgi:deazaflavin-dependent oxidoreductase (nitroreductase family)
MIDERIEQALMRDRTIDITTIGRKSGQPRRIEIWSYPAGGRVYLSGRPGRRAWYANLLDNPEFTFHLKGSVKADLPAKARPVIDAAQRRVIFSTILKDLRMEGELEAWIFNSPLMEIEFIHEQPTK